MDFNEWNENLEQILVKIRLNCIIFSNKHTANHLHYKGLSKFFEVPTIILSVISGSIISAIGLNQSLSIMTSTIISSIITILTSIKLYMKINENISVEQELSISYKILGLDVFKMLSLPQSQRTTRGHDYLNEKYGEYTKLVQSSHILSKINDKDQMLVLPSNLKSNIPSSNTSLQTEPGSHLEIGDLENIF